MIEPNLSTRANPVVDALCREGIPRAARSLRRACADGQDVGAREDMALASLFGGLALANAGLGAVHGFAGPIGGMFGAAHGAVCAALLPHVMRANVQALRRQDADGDGLRRATEVARLLTGDEHASADEGAAWLDGICRDLSIPPLASLGVTAGDVPAIVDAAARSSSMKGNPVPFTAAELAALVERALEARA
jgi:alcohol dehydrogenase class IV